VRTRLAWTVFALAFVGVGTYGTRGSLGVFIEPWEDAFGASRGSVSLITAVGFVALGAGQPIAGRLFRRWDARSVLLLGTLLAAAGFLGGAFAPNLWIAIALVGVVASFGAGLAAVSALSYVAAELVESRQGAVFGVITAAGAGGQVLVLPLATAALGVSLEVAVASLGLLLLACAALLVAVVPRVPPPPVSPATATVERPVVREPRFWLLLVPFFVCGYTSTGLTDTHLIPYALDHHVSQAAASGALVTLAAFNVTGTLAAGLVTDRVDRGLLLAGIYAVRGATLVFLPFLTSAPGLFAFAVIFGLADFATVPPTTSLARSIFSRGLWAFALGLISAAHQVGSALGAFLGGWLFDHTGSYTHSFTSGAALLVVAAVMSFALRERAPYRAEPAPSA
jgi:predicted MFS family arabinose efflux permease